MILRHALVLAPDNAAGLKNLGHAGEWLHLLRRAVELSPDDADGHYTLGNALLRMGGCRKHSPTMPACGNCSPIRRAPISHRQACC